VKHWWGILIGVSCIFLIEDFGFKHLIWIYSGRRGVHCWVGDDRARKLSSEARSAVAEYLGVLRGGEQQHRKVYLPACIHPSLQRAWLIMEPRFEDVVINRQNILGELDRCKKMLDLVPNKSIRDQLWERWSITPATSQQRWSELCQELEAARLRKTKQEIVFQYAYPRLDINVSKQIHHLLKAPFCVHPKTGRICVPIDMNKCDEFDPVQVPRLVDVFRELDRVLPTMEGVSTIEDTSYELEKKMADYKQTSLRPYIQLFEQFIRGVEEETRLARAKQQGNSIDLDSIG
jgi:DNA primase small subunit